EEEAQAAALQQQVRSVSIVAGADHVPPQHGKFARTPDGHSVSGTLSHAQFWISSGTQDSGKTHGTRVVRENVHFQREPGRTISFETDFNKGETRRTSLCGLWPN